MDVTNQMRPRGTLEDGGVVVVPEPAGALPCPPTKNESGAGEMAAASPAVVNDDRRKFADPRPLGLLAFGTTTILFSLTSANLFAMNTTTVGTALIYGGATQMLAGIMEFICGNTLGCTIFSTFGAFWVSMALTFFFPQKSESTPHAVLQQAEGGFMGVFFFLCGGLLFVAFISALRQPLAITSVFLSASLLFFIHSIAFWAKSSVMTRIAGYEGIICGGIAMYCGLALMLNESCKRTLLPLFPQCLGGSRWSRH